MRNTIGSSLTFLALVAQAAAAGPSNNVFLASELGLVLGSEETCGFSFRSDAVSALVAERVPDDDKDFPSVVEMFSNGTIHKITRMSPKAREVHCAWVGRRARALGFVVSYE